MSYEQMTAQATAILRVVAFAEEELLQTLLPTVSTLACCWNFAPLGGYQSAEISILEAGCSKASGVRTLAAHCGIALEHVMAIGDSYNDLEMIRIAGWGVAMGQAPEPVKATANAITTTNQADGVALAIERYALGQTEQVEAAAPVDMVESAALLTSFNILP
jgi:5-amino-6-(5-phospho-D-ribitylamino)uracil phosphatase